MNGPMTVPLPRFAQLEPVGECNLRCAMCPIQFRPDGRPAGKPPAFMPYDDFCRLVDQFTGLEELQLQGLGEPLMHPRFFDMVIYAAARGIRVSVNTNLTLLTPARAERCVSSGLDAIHVSIDGATRHTYEAIRVGASFAKVVRNLARLMASRAAAGTSKPSVRLVMVVMKLNLAELSAVVELAARHGIRTMFVQHLSHDFAESTLPPAYRSMRDFVNEQSLLHVDPAVVAASFDAARQRAAALDVDLRLPRVGGTPGRARGCDWPWRGAYVTYDGEALPCCMVSTADRFRMGNMLTDGVGVVWNNDAYTGLRDALAEKQPPEICRSCALYNGTF